MASLIIALAMPLAIQFICKGIKKSLTFIQKTPLFQSLETYWVWNEKAEMVRQVSFNTALAIILAIDVYNRQ